MKYIYVVSSASHQHNAQLHDANKDMAIIIRMVRSALRHTKDAI